MEWNGIKIKELLQERDLTISGLADSVSVTRQTVHNWLKGKMPKGQDLLKLCEYFKVDTDQFFVKKDVSITLIAHRTHRKAATTQDRLDRSRQLAAEYVSFFKNVRPLGIVPSLLDNRHDKKYLRDIANYLRNISGIEADRTMSYKAAFKLLNELGIFTIFRDFSSDLKSYAFFCMIENNRVVFIDSKTHVTDLIFQILHEAVHAVGTGKSNENPSKEDESFCDSVACYAQFPESYVEKVVKEIKNASPKRTIEILKSYCIQNGHSMHGITRAIESYTGETFQGKINIYPVEKNIRENSPIMDQILFEKNDPGVFWDRFRKFSPHFTDEIKLQIRSISDRKLAQLLGLPTGMDARIILEEVLNSKE